MVNPANFTFQRPTFAEKGNVFSKLKSTAHLPEKPTMVWDGNCSFCAYWIARWQHNTGMAVDYIPYEEALDRFPDIDRRHFLEASRLIEPSGEIFSGPRSAYRSLSYSSSFWRFLDGWYARFSWFEKFSDWLYLRIAKNRSFLFRLTKFLFGSNPQEVRPFWVIYLLTILYLFYIYG